MTSSWMTLELWYWLEALLYAALPFLLATAMLAVLIMFAPIREDFDDD